MNISLQQAQETRDRFERMHGERGQATLTKMRAGCMYRRALESLGLAHEQRETLRGFIALEDPHLWTLFEI
jgi:hypothetical protein